MIKLDVFKTGLALHWTTAGEIARSVLDAFYGGGTKPINCIFSVGLQEVFLLGPSLFIGGPLLFAFAFGARTSAYWIACAAVLIVNFYLLTQALGCAKALHDSGESLLKPLYYLLPGLVVVTGGVVIPSFCILRKRAVSLRRTGLSED